MKHVHLFVAVGLIIGLSGCGGGGTSSSSSVSTPVLGTPTIEATLPSSNGALIIQDPNNIQINEQVNFELVAYDATGNRYVLSPVQFTSSDTASRYGSLASNSGVFVASSVPSTTAGTTLTLTAFYNNVSYGPVSYKVLPNQARLEGKIVDASTSAVIPGAKLDFFDVNGQFVGSVTQPVSGYFIASVPINTVSFQVESDQLPAAYWRSFSFNGLQFTSGSDGCRASIPSSFLTNGGQLQVGPTILTSSPTPGAVDTDWIAVAPRSGNAPVPTGCSN